MLEFKKINTSIKELYIIEYNKIETDFECTYDKEKFSKLNLDMEFIQENESFSKKNVLRGLHIQLNHPQGKLVRVLEGEIFDVAIDLRENSESYGKWEGVVLSSNTNKMLYIPEGFAHGFLTLSDIAKVSFKVSNLWNPNDEIGIPWNDDTINIKWPLYGNQPILSEKDKKYISIRENKLFYK